MRNNESFLMFLAGVGTGAALMYFLDPDRGRRRRALVMDQAVSLGNDAREALNATGQDLSNRAYGLYAETRRAVGSPLPHSSGRAQTAAGEAATGQPNAGETNAGEIGHTAGEIGRGATSG